jgi:hypothetical protein
MEKEKTFQTLEPPNSSQIELLADGDTYKINCLNENDLIVKIQKIANSFNEPPFIIKEVAEEVLNGKNYRFEGTYNLKRTGNQLVLDNRNGRGIAENREKLKDIISYL